MKIEQLVDRDYFAISASENIDRVYDLLKERPCYAVMDPKMNVLGIVTLNNVVFHFNGRLMDTDFQKPILSLNTTITEAVEIMKTTENYFLPVYKKTTFIGIISLLSIAEHLLEQSNLAADKSLAQA